MLAIVITWLLCGTVHIVGLSLKAISKIIDTLKEIKDKMGW